MRKIEDSIFKVEDEHTSGLYHKRHLAITRGAGALVWDAEGREYIDCDTGHGIAVLGHCHPKVVSAIVNQASALLTCGESFYSEPRARLLQVLTSVLPRALGRIFLCNSGTESVEAAVKFARLATGRTKIVACKRGFHGRTLGSLSATWNPGYRAPFEPLVPGFVHITFNDYEEAHDVIDTSTAAVIIEPVQGEGGVIPATPEFLSYVRELCTERGALLVFDEVQTGMGRTGAFTASQEYGVVPDILCLSKGLGGGLPIAAVAFNPDLITLTPGVHASTFGGNPVACAAAAAATEALIEERLPERAKELGARFMALLSEVLSPCAVVREIRGKGLMIGIELKARSGRYLQMLQERGILALAAGPTVIRLLPPLVITWPQLERVAETLASVLVEATPALERV
ncbi:MAG TPA: aspartate aminotransferase family protein [Firmicutes bacterium]|nr:aspartate aminotransferase family protein [Bacillota bacterium]